MSKLQVVTCSTREGRAGEPITKWFLGLAKEHGKFEVEHVDLKALALPLLDEPNHPRFKKYQREYTKRWSAMVESADAFVFVVPEYNFFAPPALVNAANYLFQEWQYKAAGFVSYGGVSAGTRSVQAAKMLLVALKVVTIPEAVSIPFFANHLKEGVFDAPEQLEPAHTMLDELLKWTGALKPLRG